MKSYQFHQTSSISMSKDDRFLLRLEDFFLNTPITVIIESGTYLGLGSSKSIAEALIKAKKTETQFYTLETRKKFHDQAVENLRPYPFIKALWGRSLSVKDSLEFIANDEVLLHHEKYPDIYIDTLDNPVSFYSKEVLGKLGMGPINRIKEYFRKEKPEEDLLKKLIQAHKEESILFVLDSAGGIGYLEFLTVKKEMGNRPYWIIADDIHHLKHFRTFEEFKSNQDFELIDYHLEGGWALAFHPKK